MCLSHPAHSAQQLSAIADQQTENNPSHNEIQQNYLILIKGHTEANCEVDKQKGGPCPQPTNGNFISVTEENQALVNKES